MFLKQCPRQGCLDVVMNGASHSDFSVMFQRQQPKYGVFFHVALNPAVTWRFCAQVSLGEQVTPETNGASTLTRHTDEAGKKWLESNGSQRSTTNQVLGNCLYWHKRGAAFRIQIQDIAPSCSVPPSSAKHIHWSQWDLRNSFPCWYTERSLAEGGSFQFVLSCWKERGILRDVWRHTQTLAPV